MHSGECMRFDKAEIIKYDDLCTLCDVLPYPCCMIWDKILYSYSVIVCYSIGCLILNVWVSMGCHLLPVWFGIEKPVLHNEINGTC